MKFKAYTGIKWSLLELTGLLEDEDSRVFYEKFKKHLGLHPFHLTNLSAALNEILSSNLNSYDRDLKGFLLAYKNPKLLSPLGEIFDDSCFIHVDIEADFYVFRPEVGCSLKGIVNKKGLDHIGILVHKAFNVSIPKPDNEEDWPGDNLEIGQEVRFVITLLDFCSKLPFIRGVLNADDYLHGCKLIQKSISNKSLSKNNIGNTVEKSVNNELKKNAKHASKKTFFATDSENTSDEDVPQVKKEIVQQKKSKKEFRQEESIEYSEIKKKDKKHHKKDKEINESDNVEIVNDHCINDLSINGEVIGYDKLEEPIDSKSKIKKKLKPQSSQSVVDGDDNGKFGKYSPNKISRRSSISESREQISKIKFEPGSSDIEQITEESVLESKPKIKKNTLKRTILDDSDTSAAEFSTEKYIKGSSKKSSKKLKTEELNSPDTYIVSDGTQESPKKQHKKHKHSLNLETSESEVDRNIEGALLKKHERKSSILDSEIVFQNIKIKKEKVTSGSENTQEEDNVEINKVSKINPELNASTSSNNYAVEEDENNTVKKKRKKHSKKTLIDTSQIKIESGFEDVVIKIERPDDNDANWGQDTRNESEVSSPKKRYQDGLGDNISNDEKDTQSNVKHLKKKVKKEKFIPDGSDIDITYSSFQTTERSLDDNINNDEEGTTSSVKHLKKKVKKEKFIPDGSDIEINYSSFQNTEKSLDDNVNKDEEGTSSVKHLKKKVKKEKFIPDGSDIEINYSSFQNTEKSLDDNVNNDEEGTSSVKHLKKKVKKEKFISDGSDIDISYSSFQNTEKSLDNNINDEEGTTSSVKHLKKKVKKEKFIPDGSDIDISYSSFQNTEKSLDDNINDEEGTTSSVKHLKKKVKKEKFIPDGSDIEISDSTIQNTE